MCREEQAVRLNYHANKSPNSCQKHLYLVHAQRDTTPKTETTI